jgi:hypothetical protein
MNYQLKVLVVEDEPIFALDMKIMLTSSGFNVPQANNGHDALRLIEKEKPDVEWRSGPGKKCSPVFSDVTRHNCCQADLRYLGAFVNSTDDAIIGKELHGIISSWNRTSGRVLGNLANEAMGHISLLCPVGMRGEIPALLAQLRRGENILNYGTVRRHKDRSEIPAH